MKRPANTVASSRATVAKRAQACWASAKRACRTCSTTKAIACSTYEPLSAEDAPRGTVGIPRALNMYENYPFWFTFFTKLGYRVVLSDPSSKKTYEAGIESMPSESVCYPAKLSHGHVMNLLDKDVDFIWMPCAKWERLEDAGAGNHFNCPIVASYPEALRLNIDELRTSDAAFLNPWLPYDQKDKLKERLFVELYENFADATCRRRAPRPRAPKSPMRSMRHGPKTMAFKDDIRAQGRGDAALDGGDRHARHRAGGPSVP